MNSDKIILAPYYWALRLRHFFYDKGWKKVEMSPVPTICVGNIAVGGTGKTPFTELLLRLLGTGDMIPLYTNLPARVGVLSKGYGRKSKGFLYVETNGTPEQFGDEPLQIKKKFPDLPVAVCSSRIEGCKRLAEDGCELIILDDAFQYRALKADCNIVLIEYGRPLHKDHLLPLGRLRDIPERIGAADIIIASKCPDDLTEAEKKEWMDGAIPVFFTTTEYGPLKDVFEEADRHYIYSGKMILVSGIANDKPLHDQICEQYTSAEHLRFPDHNDFTAGDLQKIEQAAGKHPEAVLITTEKDCQRLLPLKNRFSENIRKRLFFQPIQTRFLSQEETDAFTQCLGEAICN